MEQQEHGGTRDEQSQGAGRPEGVEKHEAGQHGAEHRPDDIGGLQPADSPPERCQIRLHGALQVTEAQAHHQRREAQQYDRHHHIKSDEQARRASELRIRERFVPAQVVPHGIGHADTIDERHEHTQGNHGNYRDGRLKKQESWRRHPRSRQATVSDERAKADPGEKHRQQMAKRE